MVKVSTPEGVCKVLRAAKLKSTTEKELQDGIAEALAAASIKFEREVPLNRRDRLDFLIGSIALEICVAGSISDLTRLLWRYADSDVILSLVVAISRVQYVALPETISGKPVTFLHF